MTNAYQLIAPNEIPQDIVFEGYYWYSDKKSPIVIPSEPIQQSWFTEMPFVIEANFYARAEQISIQVRHIDGVYRVVKIDLAKLEDMKYDRVPYIGHDLGGRDFEVIEAWAPQADELLEGMETLIPTWTAFAGFITKK